MSKILKKIFGTILEKPWETGRAQVDDAHSGQTFDLSVQKSAVIIIFGIATVLFSLIFTGYIYSVPPEQDTKYLLKPNLLWINTFVLFIISYYFYKVSKALKSSEYTSIKKNLLMIGGLSYLFLFGQVAFWIQLMKSGNYVQTNNYFSSFYIFTALHGLHLLGGLFFWGKVASRVLKISNENMLDEEKNISALSMYWTFLLIVWLAFFLMIYVFNDAFIEWCKTLVA
tara:strand:- start:2568 stop:3248 length:681 start_codon:yes stop_codon:yes gene_type:complete